MTYYHIGVDMGAYKTLPWIMEWLSNSIMWGHKNEAINNNHNLDITT